MSVIIKDGEYACADCERLLYFGDKVTGWYCPECEGAALRKERDEAREALCRAREAIGKNNVANFERIAQVEDALSSTVPCQHEEEMQKYKAAYETMSDGYDELKEEAKQLREAVEWILDRHESGVMHPVHDWSELRRRVGGDRSKLENEKQAVARIAKMIDDNHKRVRALILNMSNKGYE